MLDQDWNGAPYHATAAPDKYAQGRRIDLALSYLLTATTANLRTALSARVLVCLLRRASRVDRKTASHFETHALPASDARFAPGVE